MKHSFDLLFHLYVCFTGRLPAAARAVVAEPQGQLALEECGASTQKTHQVLKCKSNIKQLHILIYSYDKLY